MLTHALVLVGAVYGGQTQTPVPLETPKARVGAQTSASDGGRIEFRIRTKHSQGKVRCGLYDRKADWLSQRYMGRATAEVNNGFAVCIFFEVRPGRYAAVAYHDKNNDGELNRNFFGIPSEDFAFTSGAKAGLGPPSFEDADFEYRGGLLELSGKM